MHSAKVSATRVLEDDEFCVVLDDARAQDIANGFLQRKCFVGPASPAGLCCVGSFGQDADGTWSAKVAAPLDPSTDSDCEVVARGVERLDAIVALWHARRRAFLGHYNL